MSITVSRTDWLARARSKPGAVVARSVIIMALAGGAAAGAVLGARASSGGNEAELVYLLRAMAGLKLLFVAAAAGTIWWRLQAAVSLPMLGAYGLACAAMAAGPALIFNLAYIGPASLLLHGGVAASLVLLWRDGAVTRLIDQTIERRRSRLQR